ncbi:hypothetical protein LINPERHAP2_LOCUS41810 [Linum perenne]
MARRPLRLRTYTS